MSPLCSSRSRLAASTGSPSSTVELFHRVGSALEPITYLGMVLNLSANSSSRLGHASAKPSYFAAQEQRLGADGLVELELIALLAARECKRPAAMLEVLGSARVLPSRRRVKRTRSR